MKWKALIQRENGSATLEFLGMVPLVFMLMLIIWQFVVGVHGVIVTQSAVNEAAKVYSITGEWDQARAAAEKTVQTGAKYLTFNSAQTSVTSSDIFTAKVSVNIELIFFPDKLFPNGAPSLAFSSEASGKVIE
ncbi:TadE family protein [Bacillus sp. FJAT-27986]|uniref:TadE family protein n=1 Tax=Bacillus sp. FJAT-27986 TaxID=1743146 RepID=UPI00080AFBB3|nr:TadE family protein [Bacillus sp. FJAT-27986]OCA80721.1 hypothetical protein A8L44_16260 [Bacillus sp. FJAT-27986]